MTRVSNICIFRGITVKVFLVHVLSDVILAEEIGIVVCGGVEPSAVVPAGALEAKILRWF